MTIFKGHFGCNHLHGIPFTAAWILWDQHSDYIFVEKITK